MSAAAPRRRPSRTPSVDIIRESPLWESEPDVEATLQRAISEAAGGMAPAGVELAIVLTDDSGIQALNRLWRGLDKPTNVLSFPADHRNGGKGAPALLGDIVIAYETTKQEARAQNTPFLHHLAHLTVHGFLHLRGFDHEADDEADRMERLERQILARLDIPDPYEPHDAG